VDILHPPRIYQVEGLALFGFIKEAAMDESTNSQGGISPCHLKFPEEHGLASMMMMVRRRRTMTMTLTLMLTLIMTLIMTMTTMRRTTTAAAAVVMMVMVMVMVMVLVLVVVVVVVRRLQSHDYHGYQSR